MSLRSFKKFFIGLEEFRSWWLKFVGTLLKERLTVTEVNFNWHKHHSNKKYGHEAWFFCCEMLFQPKFLRYLLIQKFFFFYFNQKFLKWLRTYMAILWILELYTSNYFNHTLFFVKWIAVELNIYCAYTLWCF